MQKLIITSPKFSGEVNTVYSDGRELLTIDFTKAELSVVQKKYFTERVPALLDVGTFLDCFKNGSNPSDLIVVSERFEITFDMFYDKYDHKRNRIRADKAWNALSKTERVQAYYGITKYFKFLAAEPFNRNKLDPENYLKTKAWTNEWK